MKRKICRTCKADKPLRMFYRHKTCADGHYSQCKVCHIAENAENKQLKREYYAAWLAKYRSRPEVKARALELQRKRRATPRGKRLSEEYSRAWKILNPERHAESQRQGQARYRQKLKQREEARV